MKNILILGGTGFIGRHVCEKLARLQVRVSVPTRRYDNARSIIPLPLVTVLEGDIHDEATLTRLVAGHDALVNLVGELHGSEAQLNRAHAELPQKLARACAAAGVSRVVHLSAVGAGMEAPSRYLRSKARGETAIRESGLAATILRPSVVFGDGDSFINMFAKLQRAFAVLPLACTDAKFQPVWVEDLADAVIACLKSDDTIGRTYEICGPDVFTLKELVQLAGQYAGVNEGRGRTIIALPESLGRLQAWVMELAPGKPLMSRDNLASMQVDNVASSDMPGLAALGIEASALQAVVPRYLGSRGPRSSLDGMRRTAGRY